MRETSDDVSSCPVCAVEICAMPASWLSNAGGNSRGPIRRTGLTLLTPREVRAPREKDPDGRKLKTPKKSWRKSGGNSKWSRKAPGNWNSWENRNQVGGKVWIWQSRELIRICWLTSSLPTTGEGKERVCGKYLKFKISMQDDDLLWRGLSGTGGGADGGEGRPEEM